MADPFFAPVSYESLAAFVQQNPNRIFRYWVYRHGYTPYEQKQCYMDESLFEQSQAQYGVLREIIPLGSGNALLGFAEFAEDTSEIVGGARAMAYYRLSDIRLVYMPVDANNCDPESFLEDSVAALDDQRDGIYFRVPRDGKWQAVCFSDMTKEEREQALADWDDAALRRLCFMLADFIRNDCTRRCGNEVI